MARSPRRRARRRAGAKGKERNRFQIGKPNPNPKKEAYLGFYPSSAASPPRGKETAASLPNGARDRAEIRTAPRQAVTATGHHQAAPRRWRAQPRASTHAGERALDGATLLLLPRPLRTAAAAGLSELRCGVREKERERMNLGFRERRRSLVLIQRH